MTVAFAEPTEWWLEPESAGRGRSRQPDQPYSTPSSRWNAHLNHLCLETILAWLQSEYAPTAAAGWEAAARPAIWEVVNGSRLSLGDNQIAIIPSEAIDCSELEVPQEWVDIPSWAADYYLAVQVVAADGSTTEATDADDPAPRPRVRVWGYASHHQLKTAGGYDASDRTYCLDAQELSRDLSTLWVTLQFYPDSQTRAPLAPLPELSPTQATQLIERLGNPALPFPRLAVPFATWGALLERQEWRQALYQRRSQPDGVGDRPEVVRLSDWLQAQVTSGWRSLEDLFGAPQAALIPSLRAATQLTPTDTIRAKTLVLGNAADVPPVALVLHLTPEADGRMGILVQLYPTAGDALLPAAITLSLVAPTGETLQTATSQTEDDYIQLRRFRCPLGTQFSLHLAFQAHCCVETFIV
ncbi:MAG: DUF1822 family protein [Synechococcales bacterium]|nr:DUF1822 family protein [Synechococcales bacterium]